MGPKRDRQGTEKEPQGTEKEGVLEGGGGPPGVGHEGDDGAADERNNPWRQLFHAIGGAFEDFAEKLIKGPHID
jgi:hypothetical protein